MYVIVGFIYNLANNNMHDIYASIWFSGGGSVSTGLFLRVEVGGGNRKAKIVLCRKSSSVEVGSVCQGPNICECETSLLLEQHKHVPVNANWRLGPHIWHRGATSPVKSYATSTKEMNKCQDTFSVPIFI